ncbi:hypothetical protein OAF98_00485 [Planctomicrobium sp.]|jgi:hypothetical protein|nr:DNA polymerase ligase N-terminal domain-containing protein [Planctomicrobium sp.]MBT5017739.1 hypothetical protein [Planctomicrobium sp.]MDB4731908.1 hypothetical protein [bacterium]MDB4742934.1 hypothetical protein [Planctomicrobium sp.]
MARWNAVFGYILLTQKRKPRFVILEHDWPFLHWDLMLEESGRLLTWRILEEPELDKPLTVSSSPDHRVEYLDYVGPIGSDRGSVSKWDTGVINSLNSSKEGLLAEINSDRFGALITIHMNNGSLVLKNNFQQ